MDITKMKWHREGGAIVDEDNRTVLWAGWGKKGISQRVTNEEQEQILKAVASLPLIMETLQKATAALVYFVHTPNVVQFLEQDSDPLSKRALEVAREALGLCKECGQSDSQPGYEHKSSCRHWRDFADGYGHGV